MLAHYADCPCGWRATASSTDEARVRVVEHAALAAAVQQSLRFPCDCYDTDSCEYSPEPCDWCTARDRITKAIPA